LIKALEISNNKCSTTNERIKFLENRLKDLYNTKYTIDNTLRINQNTKKFHTYKKMNKSFSFFESRDVFRSNAKSKSWKRTNDDLRDKLVGRDIWDKDYNIKESKNYIIATKNKLEEDFQKKIDFALGINIEYDSICERDRLDRLNIDMALSCHDFS